nr:hypothetical protein [Caldilineaceae bacterium]
MLLALWAQRMLERAAIGEAVVLYVLAVLLLLFAFRSLPAILVKREATAPLPKPVVWQWLPLLVALVLAGLALPELSEVERPTLTFWR